MELHKRYNPCRRFGKTRRLERKLERFESTRDLELRRVNATADFRRTGIELRDILGDSRCN